MKKTTKKGMKKAIGFAPLCAAALGLIAIIMLFVPSVVAGETLFNGFQVAFGYAETSEFMGSTISTTILEFSFMNLLPYLLVLAGIVLLLLNAKKANNLFALIAAACLIAAGVLFFFAVSFTMVNADWAGVAGAIGANLKEGWTLGAGAIIAAICALLGGVAALVPIVLKK